MVLKRTAERVGTVTWVLILGGILALGLGLVLRRTDAGLGGGIAVAALLAISVGAVLVWVRSRMKEDSPP